MTTFQMSLLLPFNAAATQTIADLQAVTSLQEAELIKQAQTLVDAKILAIEAQVSESVKTSQKTMNVRSNIFLHLKNEVCNFNVFLAKKRKYTTYPCP